jgi:hypothetical protein
MARRHLPMSCAERLRSAREIGDKVSIRDE